jgi:hypothetical protein
MMNRTMSISFAIAALAACGADTSGGADANLAERPAQPTTAPSQSVTMPQPAGASAVTPPVPATSMPAAASATPPATPPAPTGTPVPAKDPAGDQTISLVVEPEREHLYDDVKNWLCLPGTRDELCTTGLDATIVHADGTTEPEPFTPAAEPGFDCFYVYPTVSNDSGSNSDLNAGSEETGVTKTQAARYSRVCRVFAPLYRQVTLNALTGGTISDDARTSAYRDVVAAFNRYLTEFNGGRGFVLIGHSQGSSLLRRLITEEIDGRPELLDRLIAAHLLGTSVAVPDGQDVGGDFKNVPVCRSASQIGCVLAYSTFRKSSPPPDNSRFGKVASGRAVCANPAALGGGKGILVPYFGRNQAAFARGGTAIATPFVSFPDFLEAECIQQGDFTYLALTVLSDPADPRVDDISGDLSADWGLHLVDVNIAMGSLVALAESEAGAYAARP